MQIRRSSIAGPPEAAGEPDPVGSDGRRSLPGAGRRLPRPHPAELPFVPSVGGHCLRLLGLAEVEEERSPLLLRGDEGAGRAGRREERRH